MFDLIDWFRDLTVLIRKQVKFDSYALFYHMDS